MRMPQAFSAREIVQQLLGDVPMAGWTIADVRASSGIRVTLSRPAAADLREAVLILRPAGQAGFLSLPQLSAMLVGASTPEHRPLLNEVMARLQSSVHSFATGEIEALLEEAARRRAPIVATEVQERARRPGAVELRLNLACNQACFFCNCDGFAPNVLPNAAGAIDIAKQLGRQGTQSLVITGGEPTLNHALLDVARAARDGGVTQVMVQTNAVKLAEPGFAAALHDAGVVALFVSLHSCHADVSDRITGVPATHVLTLQGMDAALENGMSVITNFVINGLNLQEPPTYVTWLRARFAGAIAGRVFSFMAPVAAALNHLALMPRIAEVLPPLRAALDECRRAQEWVRVAGVCGLPLCVLSGYEQDCDEAANPFDVPLADDRMKLDSCTACIHERRCSGIWKCYVERYGAAEFVPIIP